MEKKKQSTQRMESRKNGKIEGRPEGRKTPAKGRIEERKIRGKSKMVNKKEITVEGQNGRRIDKERQSRKDENVEDSI